VDIESKIWSLTNTGTKLHVFKDGVALCSKAIRERTGPGEGFDYCEAKQGPFKLCTSCDVKFNEAIETAETPAETPEPVKTIKCVCPRMEPPAKYGHHVVCPLRPARTPTPRIPAAKGFETRVWAGAVKGWDMHIVRDGKALCDRPVSSVRLTDTEANSKLVANKLTRKCFGCTDIYQKENQPMGYDQRKRTGPLSPGQKKILDGLTAGQRQSEIAKEMGASRSYISAEARVAAARMGVETTNAVCARWGTALAYLDAADLIERDANYNGEDAVAAVLHELVKILRSRAAALIPS
jgi:hypothetical protein